MKNISKNKISLFCSVTAKLLKKIWIDVGFDEQLLMSYDSIRTKVKIVWKEAVASVCGGTAANRFRLKKKTVNSLGSIVDILSCRL